MKKIEHRGFVCGHLVYHNLSGLNPDGVVVVPSESLEVGQIGQCRSRCSHRCGEVKIVRVGERPKFEPVEPRLGGGRCRALDLLG